MHIIANVQKSMGIRYLLEQQFKVTRFVRALRPEGNRKRLLLQFYAWDEHDFPVAHGALRHIGGRKHTIAADDIASIR